MLAGICIADNHEDWQTIEAIGVSYKQEGQQEGQGMQPTIDTAIGSEASATDPARKPLQTVVVAEDPCEIQV